MLTHEITSHHWNRWILTWKSSSHYIWVSEFEVTTDLGPSGFIEQWNMKIWDFLFIFNVTGNLYVLRSANGWFGPTVGLWCLIGQVPWAFKQGQETLFPQCLSTGLKFGVVGWLPESCSVSPTSGLDANNLDLLLVLFIHCYVNTYCIGQHIILLCVLGWRIIGNVEMHFISILSHCEKGCSGLIHYW